VRRLFWVAMGVTIGALVVRKVTRAAEQVSPRGLTGRAGAGLRGLTDSMRDFATDVRTAMAQREAELREGAALDAGESSVGGSGPPAVRRHPT
jgi:adenylosuccinate lyase